MSERCKATISFDGGTVVQCARDEHGVEEPPHDRMALHWDEPGTTRWSTYPDFVLASFARVEPDPAEKIKHPQHYGGDTVYEARKVIRAWGLGFNLGNVAKYICRAEHKGAPLDDLKKAAFYLNDEIEMRGGA